MSHYPNGPTYSEVTLTTTTTVANTVTETNLFSHTLPIRFLRVGRTMELRLLGRVSSTTGTETCTIRIKLAGATIATFVIPAAVMTAAPVRVQFILTNRTEGTSGQTWWYAEMLANGIAYQSVPTAVLTYNTSGVTTALAVTAQWSAADAGNTISVDLGTLFSHN